KYRGAVSILDLAGRTADRRRSAARLAGTANHRSGESGTVAALPHGRGSVSEPRVILSCAGNSEPRAQIGAARVSKTVKRVQTREPRSESARPSRHEHEAFDRDPRAFVGPHSGAGEAHLQLRAHHPRRDREIE